MTNGNSKLSYHTRTDNSLGVFTVANNNSASNKMLIINKYLQNNEFIC